VYFPPRMFPASLLLYFAAGSTRRPVHSGKLSVHGRSTTAADNSHVDGATLFEK
jgi:hypothetical protein